MKSYDYLRLIVLCSVNSFNRTSSNINNYIKKQGYAKNACIVSTFKLFFFLVFQNFFKKKTERDIK